MDDTTALLKTRRFLPLLAAQTLGAVNDNLYKNALVVLALFSAAQAGPILVAAAGGLFILPYVLFSATAGQLADRFDKASLIRIVKAAEVAIMAAAAAGFMLGSIPLLMAVLFGLGIQATFFSPLKYGILPDHLAERELVAGNGLIEAGTFLGILVGTIAGGALIALPSGTTIVSVLGLLVAAAGFGAACRVPPARPAAPGLRIGWNVARDTLDLLRIARANRPVWLSILGLSWFWTVGATLLSEFPVVAKQDLAADSQVVTYLLTVFAIGVGTGSVVIARILKGEVTARHVPFAAFGISLFTWDFATTCMEVHTGLPTVMDLLSSGRGWRMSADLFLLAACGGIYSVPLYAIVQDKSDAAVRSRMIACNNVVNAAFMVAGAGCAAALAAVGVSAPRVLVILSGANLAASIWIVRIIPQDTLRALLRWYFLNFHDAEITGLENAAAAGDRTVVVANHLSFLDGAFIAAFLPGYPVFAIDTDQARRLWFLKYLIELFPVDPTNPMSTKSMVKAVREGRRLVIFPEGRLTLTGALMKIYDGPGTIADKAGASILPVRIDGLEFHRMSRMRGKLPQRWFPKFVMKILPPRTLSVPDGLRGRARRQFVGKIIEDVMTYAAFRPERADRTLCAALLDARARYDRGIPVIADAQRNEMGYGRVILNAIVLGRKLSGLVTPGEPVGLMLPNSAGAVIAFFALQSRGLVPAMMNLSAGADTMISSCAAAKVTVIVSSREFVRRAKLEKLVEAVEQHVRFVWLEDIRQSIGFVDKLAGKLASLFPGRLPGVTALPDAPAVILFTSGSEGKPKGVVHSHRSLLSNCAQVAAVIDFNPADRVLNALPMFHSFGLTGGTLLPIFYGVRAFHYPSPLHYKIVPEIAYQEQSTVMFGTDTFLAGYARKAHPMDFQSLRYIVGGAERVKPQTRQAYMQQFGKPIFEGYGATETAPVLAVNTPAHTREGTVGRFLPGIAHRLEPVPGIDRGGRLSVRGPNVMLGYLKVDAPGILEAPPDGWYDTGDIVDVDDDGFVIILGRAKRFAKIGGEMASLAAAEELASGCWPDAVHAVVALPDPRKGEQLLLVTTQADATARTLLGFAQSRGTAEIMVPRAVEIVPEMPLLGTGKIDSPAIQRVAEAWFVRKQAAPASEAPMAEEVAQ